MKNTSFMVRVTMEDDVEYVKGCCSTNCRVFGCGKRYNTFLHGLNFDSGFQCSSTGSATPVVVQNVEGSKVICGEIELAVKGTVFSKAIFFVWNIRTL